MASNVSQLLSAGAAPSASAMSDRDVMISQIQKEVMILVPDNHFFPAKFMIGLLDKYDASDLKRILEDFRELKSSTFANADKTKRYVVTAGGPDAGKSTYFEKYLDGQETKFAYIDPDRSCLLHMKHTYLADRESNERSPQEAYTHWREASNLLANVFLAYALDQGYAVAHGSTMADPRSLTAMEMIGGGYGYTRTLLHFTCELELRKASEKNRRENGVVQCTDEDLVNKGNQFHERLEGYLKQTEDIIFLYRTDMETVVEYGRMADGQLTITDPVLREKAAKEHDAVCGEGDWNKKLSN